MAYFHCITGNGGETPYGFLTVNYPSGATVTVTNCQSTYKQLTTTSRLYYVNEPSSGSTISCVVTISQSGQTSVTQTVAFTEEAQAKSVTLSFFSATITASFPSGTTECTCSDGTTTYYASASELTALSAVFTVLNSGTWTVECTNGTKTASEDVSITTSGQSESVTLSYAFYIIQNGVVNSDYTLNIVAKKFANTYANATQPTVTYGTGVINMSETGTSGSGAAGYVYFSPLIDLSAYSTLTAEGAFCRNSAESTTRVLVAVLDSTLTSSLLSSDTIAYQNTETVSVEQSTLTLDLTSISAAIDSCYIAIVIEANTGTANTSYANITDLYLEE